MNKLFTYVLVLALSLFAQASLAAMSSANFSISQDAISAGGSEDARSANFGLIDTLGENGSGRGSSVNYELAAGHRYVDDFVPQLQFSLSGNAAHFGALSALSVATGSVLANVSTNAQNGYSLAVYSDGAFRNQAGKIVPDVADGTVTAGAGEYGLGTSGTAGLYNAADTSVTTTLKNIASNASWVYNESTTVTFKAAISPLTASGAYNQAVTFICTPNF